MREILERIADCFEVPPSKKGNDGRKKIRTELENYLAKQPLTDEQKSYLISLASDAQKSKLSTHLEWESNASQQASFIEHGLNEGLLKRIGAIYGALEYSSPSNWAEDLQETHTLMKDLIHNAPIITNGLNEGQFLFYAQAIRGLEEILPEFETALQDNGIDLEEKRPEQGVEHFNPMDKEVWNSFSSTSTFQPPGPGRPGP